MSFILVIYSNVSQLTYSLIGPLPGVVKRVKLIRVFLSFHLTESLVFSGAQHGVRSSCGVVRDRTRLFENIFAQKMD